VVCVGQCVARSVAGGGFLGGVYRISYMFCTTRERTYFVSTSGKKIVGHIPPVRRHGSSVNTKEWTAPEVLRREVDMYKN
jgi:hypothetical protein